MNETCKDCGGPVHWVLHLGLWYHDSPRDSLTCPAETVEPAAPVTA